MKESQEFQEEQKLAKNMSHKNPNSSTDFNLSKRMGFVLLSSIFVCELLIMLLALNYKIQFSWFDALIDSFLLVIMIFPVIYFFVIRPLTIQNNERKRVEDALRESESKYRSLVETAQELVWKCDANGRFTYLNPAWEKTHGYKVDEMLGKNFSEFQRPEVFERDIIEFTRHMAGGSVKEYETNHNTKDGKELTLLFNAIPLFDQNGNVIGTQGTAIDITERKHAERLLKESEFRLKFHIENSPMATIEWDTDFIVTRWAGEAEKIFGWSAPETIGKPIMDLQIIYEEDIPIVEKTMERLTDGISKNIVSINRNYTKHRKIIYCEWYNSILYNAKGEMISVMSQVLDITDRRLVEKALQENEKRYHMLFQNLIVGFALHEIILDAKGKPCDYRFLEINPAFEILTGLRAIDLIGNTNMEVLPNTEPYWIDTYGQVALTGKVVNFENYSRELGKHFQVHAYSPEHGKFVTIFLDITDRKLKELKISESEANLAEAQRIAHIGSWNWDLVLDTVVWSKEMFRVFDIDPETYDGKPETLLKVLHPDDVEHFTTSMNSNRAGGKSLNLEYRVIHNDGSIHAILANGRVEVNGAGTPVRNTGIVQDITERKLAESERKQSQEKLRAFAAMLQQKREEERKSIAREIHDEFGQVLTAIKMNLTILGNEVKQTETPFNEANIIDEINNMKNIINHTIQKVRIFTNKLRPDVLDTFGLVEALDAHISEFGKLYNLKCFFVKPDEDITIEMDKSISVYRIVQEALTNVARHANATEVRVHIYIKNKTLIVSVEDNGIGVLEKQLGNEKKFGITGMKERAFICGGSITFSSPRNEGTKVELTIPFKEND